MGRKRVSLIVVGALVLAVSVLFGWYRFGPRGQGSGELPSAEADGSTAATGSAGDGAAEHRSRRSGHGHGTADDASADPATSELVRRAAAGDSSASFALAEQRRRCREAAAALAAAEQIVRVQHQVDDASDAERANALGGAERMLDMSAAGGADCGTADASDDDDGSASGDWLRKAMEQGNQEARLCYLVAPESYAPEPLTDAWHAWYRDYSENAPRILQDLLDAGIAEAAVAGAAAYAGYPTQSGRPAMLHYALGDDPVRAAQYFAWQRAYAVGARAEAFGDLANALQARLGMMAFAQAGAAVGARPALHWLGSANPAANSCTAQLYNQYLEIRAAMQP